jgi:hypothetical protein
MMERKRLASFHPAKLGETELKAVTDAMHTQMLKWCRKYPSGLGRKDAIRRHCLDCCLGQPSEVRLCAAIHCALWPFRFGGNPYRSKAKKIDPSAVAAAPGSVEAHSPTGNMKDMQHETSP